MSETPTATTQAKTIWVVLGMAPNYRIEEFSKPSLDAVTDRYTATRMSDGMEWSIHMKDAFPDPASANARIVELCEARIAELDAEKVKCETLIAKMKGK